MPLIDSLSADERTLFALDYENRQRQKLIPMQNEAVDERQKLIAPVGRPAKYDVPEIMKRFELFCWCIGKPNIKAFCAEEGIPERTFRHMRSKWLKNL